MEQLKQLSIFSENKPGRLTKITKVLAEEGVNILAINIASSDGFGVIRFIVDKCELAAQKLRQKGFTVSLNEVMAIELVDRPGGLFEVSALLSKKKINIENAYVLILGSRKKAFLIVDVNEIEKAKKLLKHENLRFFTVKKRGESKTVQGEKNDLE
ncbi:MAG: ACT domain-containing protein [Thermodesulfovibrionales bacterium]|nr:ACT domain-containing protein [Thermodesulfovibrionales bacterium]